MADFKKKAEAKPQWQIDKEAFQAALKSDVDRIGEQIAEMLRADGIGVVFMECGHLMTYHARSEFHPIKKIHTPTLRMALGADVKQLLNDVLGFLNNGVKEFNYLLHKEDLQFHVAINYVGKYLGAGGKSTLVLHYQAAMMHRSEIVELVTLTSEKLDAATE
jgi:hypothetical protein